MEIQNPCDTELYKYLNKTKKIDAWIVVHLNYTA